MTDATVAASEKLNPLIWKVSIVAMFGTFLSQMDATVVNVSLSRITADLHSNLSTIQWITSGYLLALTLVLPLNSWAVNRIGAKALYIWCFSSFTLSSVLCGFAWSAESLIFFRVLQGVSGGLLAPMTQMMIARVAGRHMPRVIGYTGVPVLMAPIIGPVLAGAILQYGSWHWLFFINVPIGGLALLLSVLFLPNDREEARPQALDWTGLALLSPGLVLLLSGMARIGETTGVVLVFASLVLIGAFIWSAVRKGERALIDLKLFRRHNFSAAALTMFISNGVLFSGQMLIPIFLIRACGKSPAEMGWLLAPAGIGMMLTSPWLGRLTQYFGGRRVSASGALLAFLATLPFLFMAENGFNHFVFLAALMLRGMGQITIGVPSMSAAYEGIPRHELPMATTTLNIIQRLGGPMLTTVNATFLAWQLELQPEGPMIIGPYLASFLLLCLLHLLLFFAALRLPVRLGVAPAQA